MKFVCPVDKQPCTRKVCLTLKYCSQDRRRCSRNDPLGERAPTRVVHVPDDRELYDDLAGRKAS